MDDVQSATVALQAENGVSFFGRDIKIAYAKETSTRIAKRDGTYSSKAVKQSKKKGNEPTDEIVANEAPVSDQTAQSSTPFAPPSHLLLAQDLPEDVTQEMLQVLFQPYSGFKEARLPRPGLAFIEFESEAHATLARKGLNGFQLTPSDQLKLDYGKA
jgi:RNA recognition motif-containing protein